MKIAAAAIQMPSEVGAIVANRERADRLLRQAHHEGATLAVLPEMFNTGYGLIADYAPLAEPRDGPTISWLSGRSRQWGMGIAAGFVERDGHDLYDSLGFCLPDGSIHVYRKQNLVFWEPFRFRGGKAPLIVETPWGRIGFGICADMIYRSTWTHYRDRVDLAMISSAWPDFACRHRSRPHWLFGRLGPLSATLPGIIARDLGVPVIFANQCGATATTIPMLGLWIRETIADRFAGLSSVSDGRHASSVIAQGGEQLVLSEITIHPPRGLRTWHFMSRSASVA